MTNNQESGHEKGELVWVGIIVVAIVYIIFFGFAVSNNLMIFNVNISEFILALTPFFSVVISFALVYVTLQYVKETKKSVEEAKKSVKQTKTNTELSRKSLQHQVILEIQKNYRADEMGNAIRGLWDFRDKIEKSVKKREKYNQKIKEYEAQKNEKKIEEFKEEIYNKIQKEMLKEYESKLNNTPTRDFDNKRRLVSYYFQHLHDMTKDNTFLIKYLKDSFLEPSMKQTIDFILIPMEQRLVERINNKKRLKAEKLQIESQAIKKLEILCKMIKIKE